ASVHVSAENNKDILLSSADQMILHSIEQMNAKIDKMNSDINIRFDNLWFAMVTGFIGVMGIIAAIVFWDRKTFIQQTKKEVMDLFDDKRKLNAMFEAFTKMSENFSEIKESMRAHGFA
ncbi:MAG: hypothetical protein U9N77_03410, partial [Thermodesulfobacteriota bacterium]|nr:hypothetical protein [Thermodesulfobacteriota bacterium]